MDYESVCNRLRDDIAHLLLDLGRPTLGTATLAARATHDIADALHHAAGSPDDARWYGAFASLERFIQACGATRAGRSPAYAELRAFLEENVAA